MAKISPKVYIDSCVFLNVIKREAPFWPDSTKVLLAAERGDIRLVASTLLLVEVGSYRGDVDAVARDAIVQRYLQTSTIEWFELDRLIARETRAVSEEFRLRGADAAHLATALRARADYFMSRDRGFPYGQRVRTTQVSEPTEVWDRTTEDETLDLQAGLSANLRAITAGPRIRFTKPRALPPGGSSS